MNLKKYDINGHYDLEENKNGAFYIAGQVDNRMDSIKLELKELSCDLNDPSTEKKIEQILMEF